MRLIRVELENFRQFLGESALKFSGEPQKSVTIIHGENGVGKTTILNAIYWCLYGSVLTEFERPEHLVNDTAYQRKGITEARVEVQFTHNNRQYRVERRYDQNTRKSTVQGFAIEDGNNVPIHEVTTVINRIIPESMAPYFFFHGEGLTNLGSGMGRNSFREAIRAILGFQYADNAVQILQQIRVKWQKQFAKLERLDAKAQEAIEEEAHAEEQKIESERKYREACDNLSMVEAALEDINTEIAKLAVQDVDKLHEQRNRLEARKKQIPMERRRVRADKQALISRYGWAIFGYSLLRDSAGVLNEFRTERKIPAEYNDRFINSLLETGECICGCDLNEDTAARMKVESLLAGASTSEQEDALTSAIGIAENIEDVSDEYIRHVNELHAREQRLQAEDADLDRQLEGIKAQLGRVDEPTLAKLEADREEQSALAQRLRDRRHLSKLESEKARKSLEQAKRRKASAVDAEKLGDFNVRLKFVDLVLERLREITEVEEASARKEIEEVINARLEQFSRKDYFAEVGDDFSFELKKRDGAPVAKSKGEKALLNVAFIASLIQIARTRSEEHNEYFVQGTVAPFVVDAPFGELDNVYRGAVAQFLPESTEQLVVLLSSSHWSASIETGLRPRTGIEYILVSESDVAPSADKTVDCIEINGRRYECSRYGKAENKTVVEVV